MTTVQQPAENLAWYALSAEDAAGQMGVDPDQELDAGEAERRLARVRAERAAGRAAAERVAVARGQLVNPMNIMLLFLVPACFAIVQIATAVVVLGLVTFNVVMGTAQELKARASVEALATLQVPHARVRRSGQVAELESTTPVRVTHAAGGRGRGPGGRRIVSSATLEVQEAALTGESAPIRQGRGHVARGRGGSRRPDQPGVPQHPGHPGHRADRGDRTGTTPRWASSPGWSPPPSVPGPRCSANWTA